MQHTNSILTGSKYINTSRLFFRARMWHRWNANERHSSAVNQCQSTVHRSNGQRQANQ